MTLSEDKIAEIRFTLTKLPFDEMAEYVAKLLIQYYSNGYEDGYEVAKKEEIEK